MPADWPLDAAVFDLDGTLVDTEPVWAVARARLLALHGIHEHDDLKPPIGGSRLSTVEHLRRTYGIRAEPAALVADLTNEFDAAIASWHPIPRPGAADTLRLLAQLDCPVALATGASRTFTERVIGALGWSKHFRAVVTGSDVAHPKPAPDAFIQAVVQLGVPPRRCLAFEDSPIGVASARSAGLFVVGVIDARWVRSLPKAHLTVDSLCELVPERLSRWLGP